MIGFVESVGGRISGRQPGLQRMGLMVWILLVVVPAATLSPAQQLLYQPPNQLFNPTTNLVLSQQQRRLWLLSQ
jgi:hypothetical protein